MLWLYTDNSISCCQGTFSSHGLVSLLYRLSVSAAVTQCHAGISGEFLGCLEAIKFWFSDVPRKCFKGLGNGVCFFVFESSRAGGQVNAADMSEATSGLRSWAKWTNEQKGWDLAAEMFPACTTVAHRPCFETLHRSAVFLTTASILQMHMALVPFDANSIVTTLKRF